MPSQPCSVPQRRTAAPALLLLAAGALTSALLGGEWGTESFLAGPSLSHSLVRGRGQELAAKAALAGAAGPACEGRASSPVAMWGKRQKSWDVKQLKNYWYAKTNPRPALGAKELKKRITKVQLMRRLDLHETEKFIYCDPREKKFQMPVKAVKKIIEDPEFKDEDRERENLGIPLSPIRLYANAINELRGAKPGGTKTTTKKEAAEPSDEKAAKGKKDKGVDLASIDDDFLAFKGIQLSKKQKAQRAAAKVKSRKR